MIDKIGNVKMNYDFYSGSDEYNDGDIEEILLDYVQNNKPEEGNYDYDRVMNILENDNRWPILYHLSPVRQNILDWYDFKEGARVLEVGAGCGAVTAALCRQASKVTCVELSKRRATINAYRNQNFSNLEIMVANFNDIHFEEKYDYITLIGVLEYANYYTGGDDSFVTFLEKIKKLLKPDGKLLIAIENKFGLKYFAGQVEDHTGCLFDGIENYVNTNSKVRTFSKDELTEMMKEAGFKDTKFYYPFPDYKFPMQIFSDEYLPKAEDLVCSLDSYDNDRIRLFDETAAFAGIVKANKFDVFSNSYFVEVGINKEEKTETKVYSKLTKERRKEYQIETAIYYNNKEKTYRAVKKAIMPDSEKHVRKMYEKYLENREMSKRKHYTISLCKSEYNKSISFDFVNGNSICDKLLLALKKSDKKAFEKILFEYQNVIYEMFEDKLDSNDKLQKVSGLNIDLTFDNIIEVTPGQYKVIDYEWYMEEELPIKYVFYRAISAFYIRYQDTVSKFYSLSDLFNIFGIDEAEAKEFYNKNLEFIDFVYDSENGYNKMLKAYRKNTHPFTQRNLQAEYFAQLFIDSGNGFSEENSMKQPLGLSDEYTILRFNVAGKGIKALRFDPVNVPAIVKIKKIAVELNDGTITELNIKESNEASSSVYSRLFEDDDPQTILDTEGIDFDKATGIVIQIKIVQTHFENISEVFRMKDIEKKSIFEKEKTILNQVFTKLEDNRAVLKDIDKYYTVTKKLMAAEELKDENERKSVLCSTTFAEENSVFVSEMIKLEYLRRDMEKELKAKIEENRKLSEELNYIKGTKAYRCLLDKKVTGVFGENR